MLDSEKKIFCIGFNKTGTSSLSDFFVNCGLTSEHNHFWPNYSKVENGKKYFESQCYSDGEQSDFIQLEKWFPGSLFILNYRDEREWLRSRIKHVLRYNEQVNLDSVLTDRKYAKMAKDFFFDEEETIKKWISELRIYVKQARRHFKNKINFIEVDLTVQSSWSDILIGFFDKNGFDYKVEKSTVKIHSNKRRSDEIQNQYVLEKYFRLVDSLL